MRRLLLLVFLGAEILALRGEPAEARPALPGYELRVLDLTKRVRFQVGGAQVEVAVPVFVFCPVAHASPAALRLRETQAALLKLAAKPEWTADELREIVAGLEQAAQLLEAAPAVGRPVPPAKD